MKKLPKPKYPKKYRKLFPEDHVEMKALRKKGWTLSNLADRYNVCIATIARSLDPELKARALAQTRMWLKIYNKDPAYRAKIRKAIRKNIAKRYHTDKAYNEFLKKYSYADKRNRAKYLKEYGKKYYQRRKKQLHLLKIKSSVNVKTQKIHKKLTQNGAK